MQRWLERSRLRPYFWIAFACLTSVCVLSVSKNLATLNQNDFFEAFDSLLEKKPLDVAPYNGFTTAAFVWAYSNSNSKPLKERNLSWIYLWAHTRLQRLFSTHFDVFFMALISKMIVLACCCRLATVCMRHVAISPAFQVPLFLLFVLAVSFAHNIAFLNSFYGEHTFFVFLPVALLGLFEQKRWVRVVLVSVGLLMCSGAKPQYFYLAGMAAGVMALMALVERRKVDLPLIGLLLVAFGISWFYAFNADTNAVNYYNSTYFGSYLLLPDEQLKQLGVKEADFECVGVDPWGNRIERRDTLKLSMGPIDCMQRIPISLRTVLAPYLRHPGLLINMWRWAAPAHFTVMYFHVGPGLKYVIPSDGKSFHGGRALMLASRLRERFVTPHYLPIIIAGFLLPFVTYKSAVSAEIKTATLILALFIPSQFAVSLLGEGVRDLSKHLAGAQFSLDLLGVFLVLQLAAYAYQAQRRSPQRLVRSVDVVAT